MARSKMDTDNRRTRLPLSDELRISARHSGRVSGFLPYKSGKMQDILCPVRLEFAALSDNA